MLGVVRGVPGDRAPISIRIVIQTANPKAHLPLGMELLPSAFSSLRFNPFVRRRPPHRFNFDQREQLLFTGRKPSEKMHQRLLQRSSSRMVRSHHSVGIRLGN